MFGGGGGVGGGYLMMNINMAFTLVGVDPDSLFCLHGKSLCKVCGSLSCRTRFHSMTWPGPGVKVNQNDDHARWGQTTPQMGHENVRFLVNF